MSLCKFSLKWYQFSQIVDFIKLIIYNKSRWWEYDNVICRKTDRFGNKAWCDFWRRQKCLSLWIWQFAVYFITVLFLCPVENKNKPLNSEQKKRGRSMSVILGIVVFACSTILYCVKIKNISVLLSSLMLGISVFVIAGYFKERSEQKWKRELWISLQSLLRKWQRRHVVRLHIMDSISRKSQKISKIQSDK